VHPAWSVILLTTLIGVGQGLFVALVAVQAAALVPPGAAFYWAGAALAAAFLAAGLAASFFHLGHPERAWRAAAMWRTSWLSREVIVLPAFMACVAAFGLGHALGWPASGPTGTLAIGALGLVLCTALFVCTAMIYACLRFLQEWHSPLTVVNYVLFGCASGLMLATGFAALVEPALTRRLAAWAAGLTAVALATRGASLVRNARLKPKSTLQTATGVKHPRIVQTSQGFMGGSFNTREFFHGAPETLVRSVKWMFLVAVFPVPLALLAAGLAWQAPVLHVAAFAVQYAGLLAERWFFFAQANHPQNLYYQRVS
jgi:sulfite dehydrogenase (quinone) subunit SoeC